MVVAELKRVLAEVIRDVACDFCFSRPHFHEAELSTGFQQPNKSSGLSWSCTCLKPVPSSLDLDLLCFYVLEYILL